MSQQTPRQLPPALTRIYPFKSHYFATAEGRMHYLDEGEGVPIVFVHGNPTWSFFFRNLILGLRASHRCIAVDHIGCGLSDKPAAADYRLKLHALNLNALIAQHVQQPFHLVVHDWGGPIGLLASMPWHTHLLSVTVMNTAAFRSHRIPWRIALCRWPGIGECIVRGLNGFAGAAVRMAVVRPLPAEVKAGYLYPYGSWADRVAVHRFVADIPLHPSHPSYGDLLQLETALEKLNDIPVQLLWGARDFCFDTRFLAEWQQRLPHAPVHRLDQAGHYLLEDAPESCLEHITDWVRAHAD